MHLSRIGIVAFVGYVATIWLANWLVVNVGIVDVPGGLHAPAGVYAAGLALTLRDLVQDFLGRRAVIVAIILGGLLSLIISPTFAAASAIAFLVSEGVDMIIYTPLRERFWPGAVFASNTVGAALDSWLFLSLSGLGLAFFWGQFVGKVSITIISIAILYWPRRALLARYAS